MDTATHAALCGQAALALEGGGQQGGGGDGAGFALVPGDSRGCDQAMEPGQQGRARRVEVIGGIRIVVHGTPAPQGSKAFKGMTNSGRAILAESSKKVKPWRQDVKAAAEAWIAQQASAGSAQRPIDGPVIARMTFTLKKPASAPKRRRTYPIRTPDLSKLVRSTEDALTDAGIWTDDARVIECRARKVYPGEGVDALASPGCVIEIVEVIE